MRQVPQVGRRSTEKSPVRLERRVTIGMTKVKHVHNPIARAVRTAAFRPRKTRAKKGKGSYRRKGKGAAHAA